MANLARSLPWLDPPIQLTSGRSRTPKFKRTDHAQASAHARNLNVALLVSLALGSVAAVGRVIPDVPRSTETTRTQQGGPTSLTGQDIGQAATATRAVFNRLLAETGTNSTTG